MVRRIGWSVAFLCAATACDPGSTLHPVDRSTITPQQLYGSKAMLPTARLSAIGDFQIGFGGSADEQGGGHEGHINMVGLFVDELTDEETFPTRIQIDARVALAVNGSLRDLFLDLQTTRVSAERTDTAYQKFDSLNVGHAEVVDLAAFDYVMFAENYCSGIPFSTLAFNGTITYGQSQTTAQMYATALADFQRAAHLAAATVVAANDTNDATTAAEAQSYLYAAQVGIGRVLLDEGQFVGAAAAVQTVPANFAYQMEFSTNTVKQNNGVWYYGSPVGFDFAVSDNEGTNGLVFADTSSSAPSPTVDPRVPVQNTQSFGFNGVSFPFMNQLKYPVASSNIDVADGIEAKLILAEAALHSGAYATEKANLDSARAQFVPPVFGTVGAIPIDSVSGADGNNPTLTFFRERAMDLFLTAHRLSDLRRLVRQYGYAQAQVFPIGIDAVTGGSYGTDVTFPGSSDEANNPNYHGCFNRDP